MSGKFTPGTTREAGRKGGRVSRSRRLSLDRVERELPPMDSIEAIVKRLEIVSAWATAGMISGTVAHSCVRAAEIGLRAFEAQMSRQVVGELRARLEQLENATKGRARLQA